MSLDHAFIQSPDAPVPVIGIPFPRPWSIRLPTVFRKLGARYVDDFFRDGLLRLSSFEAFQKHPDEARRDSEEGQIRMQLQAPNGTFAAAMINVQRVYLICASVTPPKGSDDPKSYLCITNTASFAAAVSRQLTGFLEGHEGHCLYRDSNLVQKNVGALAQLPADAADIQRQQWMHQQQAMLAQEAIDCHFRKNSRFAHEAEYRLMWVTEGRKKDDGYIDIVCPAAIEFCKRADI